MSAKGIKILEIRPRSTAEAIGLQPGDRILSVNGHEIPDEIALRFYLSEEQVAIRIRRSNGSEQCLKVKLPEGTDLGVVVEEFKTRVCNNRCVFCFVDQLPPRARPSLRLKDDDYRLSFLHGNYITLTNLSPKDIDRIIEQKLSPLYVSVHTTDPDLRAWMLGRKEADDLSQKLNRLIKGGIQFHAQIVLIPGINDGQRLGRTLFDLCQLYPGIQSVAVVPIGLSGYGTAKNRFAPVTAQFSRELIRQIESLQVYFRKQCGKTFSYLADEFYLLAGLSVPTRDYYDDFAQIEDGVGMVRAFLDDFDAQLKRRKRSRLAVRGTLVTGSLFYPLLRQCIRQFNEKFACRLKVCPVENRFFGKSITVAGLLSGKDILESLKGKKLGDFVIIPEEALARTNRILIDDLSIKDLSETIGKPVYPGGRTATEFFCLIFDRLASNGSRGKNRKQLPAHAGHNPCNPISKGAHKK